MLISGQDAVVRARWRALTRLLVVPELSEYLAWSDARRRWEPIHFERWRRTTPKRVRAGK